MIFLSTLIGISFMAFFGFFVIKVFRLVDNELSDFEKLPYGFGLGAGLFAAQLYFYSRFNLEWNILFILFPWLVFLLVSIILKRDIFFIQLRKSKLTFFDKITLIFFGLMVAYVTAEAIARPVTSWDGWSSWLFRAKMYFVKKGVTSSTFSYIPSEYPVIVSLMSTYLYIFMGELNDRMVLLLYPAFYIFLGAMFFYTSRRLIGKKMAILFTFLLLSIQNIIRHSGRFEAGQADIILGFYIFASITLLLLYLKTAKIKNLILLQAFLAITSLIKDDGISIVFFIETLLLFLLLKRKAYKSILTFAFWLAPFLEWQFFKFQLMLPSVPSYIDNNFHPERILIILWNFLIEFMNFSNWNFLWLAFFVSFCFFLLTHKKDTSIFCVYLIVILQLLVYGGIFLFTSPDPQYHIPNVINRAFLHLAPTAMFAVGANIVIISKNLKNGKL